MCWAPPTPLPDCQGLDSCYSFFKKLIEQILAEHPCFGSYTALDQETSPCLWVSEHSVGFWERAQPDADMAARSPLPRPRP